MAEELDDPREVPWHPRHAKTVIGHGTARNRFQAAFAAGTPHHAWLITGIKGIGKATLAYRLAAEVLGKSNDQSTERWIDARAHPDLFVLERSFNDQKPRKLRTEITVSDARQMSDFFARTSANGGWRIGLVDCADDLNAEAANALLKLVEEPPVKSLLLLIVHAPGRLLRTLRSRCTRLPLAPLSEAETRQIVLDLPLDPRPPEKDLELAARLARGSAGRALELVSSDGAKAFDAFLKLHRLSPNANALIGNRFSSRAAATSDFDVFASLLLDWIAATAAAEAKNARGLKLAQLHARISETQAVVNGYNLDRRVAVIEALGLVEEALKAA